MIKKSEITEFHFLVHKRSEANWQMEDKRRILFSVQSALYLKKNSIRILELFIVGTPIITVCNQSLVCETHYSN